MTAVPPTPAPDLRERLVQAAREVVTKDGPEGLTLRAIARHAGVSHGAPRRYFPTLVSLLTALAAEGFDRLHDAVAAAIAAAEDDARAAGRTLRAVDRIAVGGRGYVEWAVADPGVFSVMFSAERCDVTDPEYQRAGYRSFGQLMGLVADGQAEGWNADLPTDQVAAVLWSNVHGMAELLIHGAFQEMGGFGGFDALWSVATRLVVGPPDHHASPDRGNT